MNGLQKVLSLGLLLTLVLMEAGCADAPVGSNDEVAPLVGSPGTDDTHGWNATVGNVSK